MILFIDKYYSSATNYIATGMEKLDLDLVIRKSYQNVHFSHVFFKFWMYTAVNATESDKRLNQMQISVSRKYIS